MFSVLSLSNLGIYEDFSEFKIFQKSFIFKHLERDKRTAVQVNDVAQWSLVYLLSYSLF